MSDSQFPTTIACAFLLLLHLGWQLACHPNRARTAGDGHPYRHGRRPASNPRMCVGTRRLSPLQEAAADAAAAYVTGEHVEATVSMYCRECCRPSPSVPFSRASFMATGSGYVVLSTCGGCRSPLISRQLRAEERERLIALGCVDADAAAEALYADLSRI